MTCNAKITWQPWIINLASFVSSYWQISKFSSVSPGDKVGETFWSRIPIQKATFSLTGNGSSCNNRLHVTLCLDVPSRKFIMSNPLVCLGNKSWGALEERTSPSTAPVELFCGQQNKTLLYKLTTEWFLSCLAPSLFDSDWEEGGDGSAMRQLCAFIIVYITIKPLGKSLYTAGYSTDFQLWWTPLTFLIFMSRAAENWLERAEGDFDVQAHQYGNINTESVLSFADFTACVITRL